MSNPSEEIRVGAGKRPRHTWLILAGGLLAAALGGAWAAWSHMPTPQPYVAQIIHARWSNSRRVSVAFRLQRRDGARIPLGRCPDVSIVMTNGRPIPFKEQVTSYGPIAPDNRSERIEAQGLTNGPAGQPMAIRLRLVSYSPPPWWKQVFLRVKPTDEEAGPASILPGSEIKLAAFSSKTASAR